MSEQISGFILPFIIFFGVLYFFIIRPGQRQKRDHAALLAGLSKGDEVLTGGGLYGIVRRIEDDAVMIEVARRTLVKVSKSSITQVTAAGKGSLDAPEAPEE